MEGGIDPRAVVAPSAKLAADIEIGAYSIIGPNVEIGLGCVIGPHVVITGHTTIGANNRIFQFASIGDAPQDKKYAGEPTRVLIGNGNTFREYVTVNRGTAKDKGVTTVGDDNLFMASSHVAHDCIVGSHCVFANLATLAGHVEIDDWVILAGFTGVHQFCKIGVHAFIANNTAVTRDVPPYVMAVGHPAEPHSINTNGISRRGFSAEQVRNIKNAYTMLYRSELPLQEAIDEITRAAQNQPELQAFVDFFPRSNRSLIR
ncbi:MAG: acyl-ACP--UDP-N-acetylglucosamine O-acyltransferase [Gammaproteobacteria bacterium]|nr:acyl-ACP--UDP-N-acetylglucosamine O-acyltransferase [Gammaproteobacteria bacterium]